LFQSHRIRLSQCMVVRKELRKFAKLDSTETCWLGGLVVKTLDSRSEVQFPAMTLPGYVSDK